MQRARYIIGNSLWRSTTTTQLGWTGRLSFHRCRHQGLEAQEAALRAMVEAFKRNGSCSFTARVGVEGVFRGEVSACGWK
jgi:hypothetical protein